MSADYRNRVDGRYMTGGPVAFILSPAQQERIRAQQEQPSCGSCQRPFGTDEQSAGVNNSSANQTNLSNKLFENNSSVADSHKLHALSNAVLNVESDANMVVQEN